MSNINRVNQQKSSSVKQHFLKRDVCANTDNITLDFGYEESKIVWNGEDYEKVTNNGSSKYSQKAIEYAKQMKAANGDKYSDQQYLQMAVEEIRFDNCNRMMPRMEKRIATMQVPDPEWAGYSYEDILYLEFNSTIDIPQNVLIWAHSQQEMDDTAYVMTTESDLENDNSMDNDPVNAIPNVKIAIKKAELSEKNCENEIKKVELLKSKAVKVQQERENDKKENEEDLEKIVQEWKTLDDKKKNGELTPQEKARYNTLKGEIKKETNNKDYKGLQAEEEYFKEYLDSIDDLNKALEIDNAVQVQNADAIDAATKLNTNYFSDKKDFTGISDSQINSENQHALGPISTLITSASVAASNVEIIDTNAEDSINDNSSGNMEEYANTVQNRNDSVIREANTIAQTDNDEENKDAVNENTEEAAEDKYGKNKVFLMPLLTGDPLTDAILAKIMSKKSTEYLEEKRDIVDERARSVERIYTKAKYTNNTFEQKAKKFAAQDKENKKITDKNEKKMNEIYTKLEAQQEESQDTNTNENIEDTNSPEISNSVSMNSEQNDTDINDVNEENNELIPQNKSKSSVVTSAVRPPKIQQEETPKVLDLGIEEKELEKIQKENDKIAKQKEKNDKELKKLSKNNTAIIKSLNKENNALNKENKKLNVQNDLNKVTQTQVATIGVGAIYMGRAEIGLSGVLFNNAAALMSNPWTVSAGIALGLIATGVLSLGVTTLSFGIGDINESKKGFNSSKSTDDSVSQHKDLQGEASSEINRENKVLKQYGIKSQDKEKTNAESSKETTSGATENTNNSQSAKGSSTENSTTTDNSSAVVSSNSIKSNGFSNDNNDTKPVEKTPKIGNSNQQKTIKPELQISNSQKQNKENNANIDLNKTANNNEIESKQDKINNTDTNTNNDKANSRPRNLFVKEDTSNNKKTSIKYIMGNIDKKFADKDNIDPIDKIEVGNNSEKENNDKNEKTATLKSKISNPFSNNIFANNKTNKPENEVAFDTNAEKEDSDMAVLTNETPDVILSALASINNSSINNDIETTDKQDNKLDNFNKDSVEKENEKEKRVKKIAAIFANKKQK